MNILLIFSCVLFSQIQSVPLSNNNRTSTSTNLPVVVVHGILGSPDKLNTFKTLLNDNGLEVHMVNVGNGNNDEYISVGTNMLHQLTILCREINKIKTGEDMINIIGISQGGLLARGYIQLCDGKQVNNLITINTPHGGIFYPELNITDFAYNPMTQLIFGPSNYWRDPTNYELYQNKSSYLAMLNNENPHLSDFIQEHNCMRLLDLNNFVMFWSTNDEVLNPPESGMFSTFDKDLNVVNMNDAPYYYSLCLKNINFSIEVNNCTHTGYLDEDCLDELEPQLLKYLINEY